MRMHLCPECGSPLEELKNKYVCSECDYFVRKQAEGQSPPLSAKGLFHRESFERLPSVVAHEYWRLAELYENREYYGAFLQMKDLFEVMIKLPTLIGVSGIYRKRDRTPKESHVLVSLLSKLLTLGDWKSIAVDLLKTEFVKESSSLYTVLSKVVKLYENHNIVNWRNSNLGHGALAFHFDETTRKDIESKLELIRDHFAELAAHYVGIPLYLREGEALTPLIGNSMARELPCSEAAVVLLVGEVKLELSPFVCCRKNGIYFFDSYASRKGMTAFINYPDGETDPIPHAEITKLYQTVTKEERFEFVSSSAEDEVYIKTEERVLDDLSRISDFSPPTHLAEWLEDAMDRHGKGVFLIQMERGMGKTTFCKALDEQGLAKLTLTDTTVRAYYINDTYLYKTANFVSDLNDMFRQDQQGRVLLSGSLHSLQDGDAEPAQRLARFLHFYKEEHRRKFGKRRLLLIIDGLDEIPAATERSLFDYIPKTSELEDQVFILLTCRVQTEITPFTATRLKELEPADQHAVGRGDPASLELLHRYIGTQFKGMGSEQVAQLLDKAEHRFLYLASIKEILNFSNVSLQAIPSGEKIFEYFLELLESSYGTKFFKPISRLLSIIASSFEPLTLKEISCLSGEESVSFKLLAYITDLRSVLKVERHYNGSLFTISHQERRGKILSHYTGQIRDLAQDWSRLCLSISEVPHSQLNAGEHYLLIYIVSYYRSYIEPANGNDASIPDLLQEAFADRLLELGVAYRTELNEERNRQRHHVIFGQAIYIYDQLDDRSIRYDRNRLILAYLKRSYSSFKLNDLPAAFGDLDRAEEICRQLDAGDLNKDMPVELHKFRCIYYRRAGNTGKALASALEALDDLEAYKEEHSEYNIQKYKLFNHIGICYRKGRDFDQALSHFDACISLQQELLTQGQLKEINDVPKVLKERALTYRLSKQFGLAESDYNAAMTKMGEILQEEDRPYVHEALSELYLYRGVNYRFLELHQESLQHLIKAVEIKKELLTSGELNNISAIYEAFRQIVVTLDQDEELDQEKMIDQILKQNEELIESGFLSGEDHQVMMSFVNYAKLLFRVGQMQGALPYMEKAARVAVNQASRLDERQIHSFVQETTFFLKRLRNKEGERDAYDRLPPLLVQALHKKNRNLLLTLYGMRIEFHLRAGSLREAHDDFIRLYETRNALLGERQLNKVVPIGSQKHFVEIYVRGKGQRGLFDLRLYRQKLSDLFVSQIRFDCKMNRTGDARKQLLLYAEFAKHFQEERGAYLAAASFCEKTLRGLGNGNDLP